MTEQNFDDVRVPIKSSPNTGLVNTGLVNDDADPILQDESPAAQPRSSRSTKPEPQNKATPEHGGPKGLEPTRYGDWEANGRCYDF